MNDSKYRYTLYLIIVVIIATIGIQTYWNYKNYQSNKEQLIKDVQTSLDKSVDDYYTKLAQETTMGLKFDGNAQKDVFADGGFLDELAKSIDDSNEKFNTLDSVKVGNVQGITVLRGRQVDSMNAADIESDSKISPQEFKQHMRELKSEQQTDSLRIDLSNFEILTSKIVISIKNDTLDLNKVDSLLRSDLKRKNIDLEYRLEFNDSIKANTNINIIAHDSISHKYKFFLSNTSKSTFLPENSELKIVYENETWVVLKRSLTGILISTLLVLAVISSLFYLLKIIKQQKQLAEVKNDLISNITHEFKTPIATIGVALESIQNFDALKDKDKTNTYLNMSNEQLSKLNTMVEKLLETATLDSENLELNKDNYNISEVIASIIEKHKIQNLSKTLNVQLEPDVIGKVDVFHFENAINNVVDNAFKYGGDVIDIILKKSGTQILISISDNGNTLTKANKDKIFEKFYRVPKGNTHDVKGFGIGLYYTKTIIEKHNGKITLDLLKDSTTFKIELPNV